MNSEIANAPHRILVIDDEPDIMNTVVEYLRKHGFAAHGCSSALKAVDKIRGLQPDLILVDKIMPGMSGNQLVTWLRSEPGLKSSYVMVISALSSEQEKLASFDLGVDDYMIKPFSLKEMLARIQALLRRPQTPQVLSESVSKLPIVVDWRAHRVLVQDREIELTVTEFNILKDLYQHFDQVRTRDQIRQCALSSPNVTDRTIDVHIASLRRKLDEHGRHIRTIHGVGYRMTP